MTIEGQGYRRKEKQRYIAPPAPGNTVAAYEPLRPVVAGWCLEFAEAFAAVFAQLVGNEVRVIGSRIWHFKPVSFCLADIKETMPWARADVNVLPPESDGAWAGVFDQAGQWCDYARNVSDIARVQITRELFPVLSIDEAARAWEPDGNNLLLIESLNSYGADLSRGSAETFTAKPKHSWEVYLVRAFEMLAVWKFDGGNLRSSNGTRQRAS